MLKNILGFVAIFAFVAGLFYLIQASVRPHIENPRTVRPAQVLVIAITVPIATPLATLDLMNATCGTYTARTNFAVIDTASYYLKVFDGRTNDQAIECLKRFSTLVSRA